MDIPISRDGRAAGLPLYATEGSAGMDVRAAEERVIEPGGRALVPTGLRVALPRGWEAQIRPRSGLALRHGIVLPNSPGTIDSDYRGEIGIIMMNLGDAPFTVHRGDRIAQMVVVPVARVEWVEVRPDELGDTQRGEGGFGSTGGGA